MAQSEKIKYLDQSEILRLRKLAEERALIDLAKGRRQAVVEWMILDLASGLGLRASEIRFLLVSDIHLNNRSFLIVRTLKRRKPVEHQLPLEGSLRDHLKGYLKWKEQTSESLEREAPLLVSNKGRAYSLRGIEYVAKRLMASAGLDGRFSIHSLRHTAGVHLLRQSKNLRLVQKVLRHARIETTTIYADVMQDEMRDSLATLYQP